MTKKTSKVVVSIAALIAISVFLIFSLLLDSKEYYPKDYSAEEKDPAVIELRQSHMNCHHWLGEEPFDKERAEEIKQGIASDCPKALAAAEKNLTAGEKYATAAAFILQIVDIAAQGDERKKWEPRFPALCQQAAAYFKKIDPDEFPDAASTYATLCLK